MFIPTDYAQVNHIFGGTAAPNGAQITFGLNVSTVTQDPSELATDLHELFRGVFETQLTDNLTILNTLVKYGPNEDGPSGVGGGPLGFSNAAPGENPNTALLVQKNTSHGGRRGRGRLYIPGIVEGNVTAGGIIDGSYVSALQACCESWLSQVNDLTDGMVLLHSDTSGPAPYAVTSLSVSGLVATQRRRLRR